VWCSQRGRMARRYWPGRRCPGKAPKTTKEWMEIGGIAKGCQNRAVARNAPGRFSTALATGLSLEHDLVAGTAIEPERMFPRCAPTSLPRSGDTHLRRSRPEEHIGISLLYSAWQQHSEHLGYLRFRSPPLDFTELLMAYQQPGQRELGIRVSARADRTPYLQIILGEGWHICRRFCYAVGRRSGCDSLTLIC